MPSMLIVEDDERVRELLYDLFADWSVCHVAATAEAALGHMGEESYDVILTDLSLPGLSGLELLSRVREEGRAVAVIVITGIDDQAHAQGLLKLGAASYIVKPFRVEEVEEAVRVALGRRAESLRLKGGEDKGGQRR